MSGATDGPGKIARGLPRSIELMESAEREARANVVAISAFLCGAGVKSIYAVSQSQNQFAAIGRTARAANEYFSSSIARAIEECARMTRGFQLCVPDRLMSSPTWLAEFSETRAIVEALQSAGWLPHEVIPFHVARQYLDRGPSELGAALDKYFLENWPSTEKTLRDRLCKCGLDGDASATIDQVFRAHAAGLYRLVAPAIFPEIERTARRRFYGSGRRNAITSLHEVRNAIEELAPGDLGACKMWWALPVYEFVQRICYAHTDETDKIEEQGESNLPNRHATVHGLRALSTLRDSLHAIFIADFMFNAINALAIANSGAP